LDSNRVERVAVQAVGSVVGALLGLALLAACGVHLWRRRAELSRARVMPWVLLTVWGLGNAAAITLARWGEGGFGPFHSRYPGFTVWFFVGQLGLLMLAEGRWWSVVRTVWMTLLAVGTVASALNGWMDAHRISRQGDLLEAAVALRHVAPEPVYLDATKPGGGEATQALLDRLEALGLLHVTTVASERTADARMAERSWAKGMLSSGKMVQGGVELEGWAIQRGFGGAVPAVAISMEKAGEPEVWLGLATRWKVAKQKAAKERARVLEDRIGWVYEPMTGTEKSFLRKTPLKLQRKVLPTGRVIFRAYAFDPVRGEFTRLPGEQALELPSL